LSNFSLFLKQGGGFTKPVLNNPRIPQHY